MNDETVRVDSSEGTRLAAEAWERIYEAPSRAVGRYTSSWSLMHRAFLRGWAERARVEVEASPAGPTVREEDFDTALSTAYGVVIAIGPESACADCAALDEDGKPCGAHAYARDLRDALNINIPVASPVGETRLRAALIAEQSAQNIRTEYFRQHDLGLQPNPVVGKVNYTDVTRSRRLADEMRGAALADPAGVPGPQR